MRIGIVRIGKERDEAAFGKELAALVDAGYQVAAGTGDMLIVRVGDPAGADAGRRAHHGGRNDHGQDGEVYKE